jgi:pantoate--beta-alanine ligase
VIVARTRAELARALGSLHRPGRRLGFVPTMGYLHEGHLSLVDLARERADVVAASIFVNPLQFASGEDLEAYPRDPARDLVMLEMRGANLVFLPRAEEMYPGGHPAITVDPGSLGDRLCGAFRPGHFRGVLTVVAKLLGLLRPDLAVFGRKDFQQLVLIERMVRELDLGVEIVAGPTVRERDGLAMSSRNSYLSAEERAAAPALAGGLELAATRFRNGERSAAALLEAVKDAVRSSPPLDLQYAALVDAASLDPVDPAPPGAVLAAAALAGRTRLIDNVVLETP